MMVADRLPCCVPFCHRTRQNDAGYSEWICGKHWMNVPQAMRRAKFAAYRSYRRSFGNNPFWNYPPGSPDRIACVAADRACREQWLIVKATAIEKAVGL